MLQLFRHNWVNETLLRHIPHDLVLEDWDSIVQDSTLAFGVYCSQRNTVALPSLSRNYFNQAEFRFGGHGYNMT